MTDELKLQPLIAEITKWYDMTAEMTIHTDEFRQWHSFYAEPPPIGQQSVGQIAKRPVSQILSIPVEHPTSTTTGSAP